MPTATVSTKRRLTTPARKRRPRLARRKLEADAREAQRLSETLPVSETALEIMRFVRPENTVPEDPHRIPLWPRNI